MMPDLAWAPNSIAVEIAIRATGWSIRATPVNLAEPPGRRGFMFRFRCSTAAFSGGIF